MSSAIAPSRAIVLASRSPRRLDLLRQLGFVPLVWPAAVEERHRAGETPEQYALRLSLSKAATVADSDEVRVRAAEVGAGWVVAADTVVVLGAAILEKPEDAGEAQRMLRSLAGSWHAVVTAFTVRGLTARQPQTSQVVRARVRIRQLESEEIARYVATGEPMDKAGAYGIQGVGGFLVREVQGSYSAVVGLPVCELIESLKGLGAVPEFPFDSEPASGCS